MGDSGLLQPGNTEMATFSQRLSRHARSFDLPENHLGNLLGRPGRFRACSLGIDGFHLDFSRQRIDGDGLLTLQRLAQATGCLDRFTRMADGETVNLSENRAALHTAARGTGRQPLNIGGMDVRKEIARVQGEIKAFTGAVHAGEVRTARGHRFTQAVVVGIGGSYLGCEFAYEAMAPNLERHMPLHFLPNVDIDNFGAVVREIDPETTLWIVISKSYTTTETMANLSQVASFLKDRQIDPGSCLVTVTAKGSPGDDPATPVLAAFHMFDFIGGRYSVSSAVGGVPLSLAYGYEGFQRFLSGCRTMDEHVLDAPVEKNIPVTSALLSVWNTVFLGYGAQAVIPYASRLSRLAPHVQQLYMESIGKSVDPRGTPLSRPAGTIIFGEPGTNAQHSFFQLAHQGPAFPIEFIGVVTPGYTGPQAFSKGVTNHQELWANLLAQARALATGRDHDDPARQFDGNRPSTIISVPDLEPERIGMILSFYEARTVLEGFILGVNPFDQFGVELGKTMASDLRREMAAGNAVSTHGFSRLDEGDQFYMAQLFGEKK